MVEFIEQIDKAIVKKKLIENERFIRAVSLF